MDGVGRWGVWEDGVWEDGRRRVACSLLRAAAAGREGLRGEVSGG